MVRSFSSSSSRRGYKSIRKSAPPAVELWPDEADYQAGLGWSLFKKLPPETEAACGHLEQAVKLNPESAQAWFHLSLVLRELGEDDSASRAQEQARRIDPAIG